MRKLYRYEAEPQVNGSMIFTRFSRTTGRKWHIDGQPVHVTDKEFQMGDISSLWESSENMSERELWARK